MNQVDNSKEAKLKEKLQRLSRIIVIANQSLAIWKYLYENEDLYFIKNKNNKPLRQNRFLLVNKNICRDHALLNLSKLFDKNSQSPHLFTLYNDLYLNDTIKNWHDDSARENNLTNCFNQDVLITEDLEAFRVKYPNGWDSFEKEIEMKVKEFEPFGIKYCLPCNTLTLKPKSFCGKLKKIRNQFLAHDQAKKSSISAENEELLRKSEELLNLSFDFVRIIHLYYFNETVGDEGSLEATERDFESLLKK